jgi:ParB family chromosome partitioning protein
VDVDLIAPNPRQPRTRIDPTMLEALTESVRQHGLLQPLVVSREQTPGGAVSYRLVAGERRLHAARAAGLRRVPVVVREVTPREQLELALVENIQRADLNPLEEASAFRRLAEEFGLTQEEVARRVGRSRVAVANTLRLLALSDEIKASLAAGEISEGHARALLGVEDAERRRALWQEVRDRGLSVRETEARVRALRERPPRPAPAPPRRDPELAAWEERLRRSLGTGVQIDRGRRGGRLVISFYSDEELDALLHRLVPESDDLE